MSKLVDRKLRRRRANSLLHRRVYSAFLLFLSFFPRLFLLLVVFSLDELIANGETGTFDMVYIDADKWNYPVYYDKCMELVRQGGIILLDDTLWEGYVCDPTINKDGKTSEVEPLDYQRDSIELYKFHFQSIYKRIAVHMHALNKKIVKDPRVLVNILPVGSGLTIVTKL